MHQLIDVPGRARPVQGVQLSGAYDPRIESAGLTLDTPLGPVDLVAIERAKSGRPTPLTPADYAYLLAHHDGHGITATAVALGIRGDSMRRAIDRARVRWGMAS